MIHRRGKAVGNRFLSRSKRMWCATLALAAAGLLTGTACDEEAAARAFRDAATGSLQTGVNSIVDGMVDGVFAMLEIGTDQDSSGS
jgi:hypothetical protein